MVEFYATSSGIGVRHTGAVYDDAYDDYYTHEHERMAKQFCAEAFFRISHGADPYLEIEELIGNLMQICVVSVSDGAEAWLDELRRRWVLKEKLDNALVEALDWAQAPANDVGARLAKPKRSYIRTTYTLD